MSRKGRRRKKSINDTDNRVKMCNHMGKEKKAPKRKKVYTRKEQYKGVIAFRVNIDAPKSLTLENKYELAELGTIFSRKAKLGTNHLPKTKKNNTHQGLTAKLVAILLLEFQLPKKLHPIRKSWNNY